MGIRLKLGLISTIKHQLTYAPPWHCTQACQPRPTAPVAFSIRQLPVVRDAETGTSGPDSAGKDRQYLSSGLRIGRNFASRRPPIRASHLLATHGCSRILSSPGYSGPPSSEHSPRLDPGIASTSDNLSPGCTLFSPSLPFLDAWSNDTSSQKPHTRTAIAH